MRAELVWFKSSHSDSYNGNCIEVAACTGTVHVRDSKDKAGPKLAFTPDAWATFVAYTAELPVA